MRAGNAFANLLAHGDGDGDGGVAAGLDGAGNCCHVVQVASSPPPPLGVELTTAHCSGVPVPPPLSTVVKPAASSIGFARLLRPPDRQNNIRGLLLSTGSDSSGILSDTALKSHSMEPAGGGMTAFSPDERRSTRTPLAARAARISDGVASMGKLVQSTQAQESIFRSAPPSASRQLCCDCYCYNRRSYAGTHRHSGVEAQAAGQAAAEARQVWLWTRRTCSWCMRCRR